MQAVGYIHHKYIEAALLGQLLIGTGEGGVDLVVVEWARYE